jgi:hypothetical protein
MPLMCPAERSERLDEFIRRVDSRPAFNSFQTAWDGVAEELDDVEDSFSGITKNPDQTVEAPPDGRIYPPHLTREVPSGAQGVRSFRQKGHLTSFAENGAVEIVKVKDGRPVDGKPVLDKAGSDGRRVSDYRVGKS